MSARRPPVTYYRDFAGKWLRREWQPQCPNRVFLLGKCQGVKNHKGVHWCFSGSGSFEWDDNDKDPKHGGCCGSTPPDHASYKTPQEMQKYYHVNFYKDTKIKDAKLIARLEKGKPPEKNAAIDRPMSEEDIKKIEKVLKRPLR